MGTPNWMAPEVAQPTPVYDSRADIWSLGIVVYEMAKGAPPHSDLRDAIKVMQLIAKVKPPRLGEGDGSKDMRDFVSHCLRESPNEVCARNRDLIVSPTPFPAPFCGRAHKDKVDQVRCKSKCICIKRVNPQIRCVGSERGFQSQSCRTP